MKKIVLLWALWCGSTFAQGQQPAVPPANFKSQVTNVNGVKIHYVIGGKGELLVLLHGFGENWYTWNRLLPELSKHFTVLAPDLPGTGESGRPTGRYDKKTMAADIHELVKSLGYKNILLAGHDIGLMVAYSYAASYRNDVKKLALMDAIIPGVEPEWSEKRKVAWWWGFFGWPGSVELVQGKEKEFLTDFWSLAGHVKNAINPEEANEFIRALRAPGAVTGNFGWFATFPQDAKDDLVFIKEKLKMPVLVVEGEYSAPYLGTHCRRVALHVKEVKIMGAGHWLVQESTGKVQQALLDFFLQH